MLTNSPHQYRCHRLSLQNRYEIISNRIHGWLRLPTIAVNVSKPKMFLPALKSVWKQSPLRTQSAVLLVVVRPFCNASAQGVAHA